MHKNEIPAELLNALADGIVIPAMPLALDAGRRFDARRQRALARYYIDAGAGGIAVGVHSTQFAIRTSGIDLLAPVLETVSQAIDQWCATRKRSVLKIAGVCGQREQALREAQLARDSGYHAVLLSLAALKQADVPELVSHCEAVAAVMPVIGFYLQTACGGRVLPENFWRRFAEIENVIAIKMSPFNRYQTLDVIRAVCEAGRQNEIVLYTGNDDNIVVDLLTPYRVVTSRGETVTARIAGGLLGHWAVWTRKAVEMLEEIKRTRAGGSIPKEMLTLAVEVTDVNAAFFDAANNYAGCIPGIHEVLRRQGLLEGTWCLNPKETLSPGQAEEIDRVIAQYPHLNDDDFVKENLNEWLNA